MKLDPERTDRALPDTDVAKRLHTAAQAAGRAVEDVAVVAAALGPSTSTTGAL